MKIFGIVNIIRPSEVPVTRSGGGLVGLLCGVFALVLVGVLLYNGAEATLVGVAASTAAANRIAAWAVGIGIVLLVAGAVGWVLLGRRRAIRDEPVVAAFTARTDRALEADRQAAALPTGARQAVDSTSPPRQRIAAQRLDRLPEGGERR